MYKRAGICKTADLRLFIVLHRERGSAAIKPRSQTDKKKTRQNKARRSKARQKNSTAIKKTMFFLTFFIVALLFFVFFILSRFIPRYQRDQYFFTKLLPQNIILLCLLIKTLYFLRLEGRIFRDVVDE